MFGSSIGHVKLSQAVAEKNIVKMCFKRIIWNAEFFMRGKCTWYPNQIPNHGAPNCQVTVRWTFQVHVALVCLSYFGAIGLSFTNHLVFQRLNHQGCLQDLAAAPFHQGRRQGLLGGWCWEQQSHHSMSLGKDVVLYIHIDQHSIIWHYIFFWYNIFWYIRNNDRSWRSNKTTLDLAGCFFWVQMNGCLVVSSDLLNFRVRFGASPEGIAVEKVPWASKILT